MTSSTVLRQRVAYNRTQQLHLLNVQVFSHRRLSAQRCQPIPQTLLIVPGSGKLLAGNVFRGSSNGSI